VFLVLEQRVSGSTDFVGRAPIWWHDARRCQNHNENSKMVAERAFLSGTILVIEPVAGSITAMCGVRR
jgi:hypothetical protein